MRLPVPPNMWCFHSLYWRMCQGVICPDGQVINSNGSCTDPRNCLGKELWILVHMYISVTIILFHTPTVAPYNTTISTQVAGNNITFICTAEGGPGNTFQWVQNSDNSVVSNSSMLTLDHTDYDDYTCTITNAAGSTNETITFDGKEIALKM